MKNIKYWMNSDELKLIANAYINGIINYGIILWSRENIKLIDQIEKIRINVIKSIMGKDMENLNDNEILKLLNWKYISEQARITKNIGIHKILNMKKPVTKYLNLTEDRSEYQIKYNMIQTVLDRRKNIIIFHF